MGCFAFVHSPGINYTLGEFAVSNPSTLKITYYYVALFPVFDMYMLLNIWAIRVHSWQWRDRNMAMLMCCDA